MAMQIRDIETVNAVACGDCGYPVCPAAVVECQSITVVACGVKMPAHPDVPAEDRCIIFKRLKDTLVTVLAFTGPDEGGGGQSGSQTDSYSCQFDYVWKTVPPAEEEDPPTRECEAEVRSNYTLSGNISNYEGGEVTSTSTSSGGSSSSPTSPCSGSITAQTTYPGEDPEEPVTEEYNVCTCPPVLDINNPEVGYTSVGNFLLSTTEDITGGTSSTLWGQEYSEPVTLDDLKAELDARVLMYGEDHDWPGGECDSTVEYDLGYADEEEPTGEPVCKQVSEATLNRYRVGVPADYSTEAHPRSVFKETWDEYFFSTEWDAWDSRVEAYEAWQALHEAWEEAGSDPETEPVEPEEPGPEPDQPVLVAEREWIWGGSMEERFSGWFTKELPAETDEPGMVRRVNVATLCYASARTGVLPTFHGEIYVPTLDEEES